MRFSALGAGYMYLPQVLIGSLDCMRLVDIKEGFWHTKICATFNRKLQKK